MFWNTKNESEKEKKTPLRNQNQNRNQNRNRNRNRKRKHRKGGKKKRQKRNSISVAEKTIAWEPPATDPATEAATERAKIKKQRSVVNHMKRLHSRFKSKKYKKRRERILFALKVFGGIAITTAEVIFIFA